MGSSASHVLQRAVESSVESFLDEDERFANFVMMTFDDESDASQHLPQERLLKALVSVYELIAAVLPPAGRRLITRAPQQSDVDAELSPADAALDFDRYDALARAVFRRLAVDRGRRVMVGVVSGVVCIAVLKATLRRTPLIGPLFQALVVPLLPCGAGPALGLVACAYLPEGAMPPWRPGRRAQGKGKPAEGGGGVRGKRR